MAAREHCKNHKKGIILLSNESGVHTKTCKGSHELVYDESKLWLKEKKIGL